MKMENYIIEIFTTNTLTAPFGRREMHKHMTHTVVSPIIMHTTHTALIPQTHTQTHETFQPARILGDSGRHVFYFLKHLICQGRL